MKIKFTKMQSLGNDYIYINCFEQKIDNFPELSVKMSKRRFSVGGDGIILILPCDKADAEMRIFNADGSEAEMCGNGIRCVGKYVFDNKIVNTTSFTVNTKAGIKTLNVDAENGLAKSITVDMGIASFDGKDIGLNKKQHINDKIEVNGKEYISTAISMGNPHNVIVCENPTELDLEKIGPEFENHPMFANRTNTEFIKILDNTTVQMRVWERGSGETLACGTGACAVVASCVKNKLLSADTPITVKLIGGDLTIVCKKDYRIFMTGNAVKVYDGIFEI